MKCEKCIKKGKFFYEDNKKNKRYLCSKHMYKFKKLLLRNNIIIWNELK
jgi:hypothetical protein